MNIISALLLGLALSMDAFACATACGFYIKEVKLKHALKVGIAFGGFQGIMPLIGWTAGHSLKMWIKAIEAIDHWIAFSLLSIIGIKMIFESFSLEKEPKTDPLKNITLLILSIATSIDALVVGLSLSLIKISIIEPALIIGIITFCISFSGVYIGKSFGHLFESKLEIIAGLILIGIGLKILLFHI